MTTRASGRVSPLAALFFCLAASCGSITLAPDGGTGTTGAAGHAQTGGAGSTGAAGNTGAAGATTGAAGSTGTAGTTSGAAGSTGTAGTTSGAAGSTGAAGTTSGAAGSKGTGRCGSGTGAAGSTGAGGAGGTGFICGPVCEIFCEYGNVLDANGCPTCACNPASAPCAQAECGTAPSYRALPCTGPPAAPATCLRDADGTCAWRAPFCPTCASTSCPNLACTSGFVPDTNGCPTCVCNTCPQGTHPMACPQVSCNIACADGFVHDANGCATCTCRAPASCAPAGVSCVACPFGYRAGPNHCRTCSCEDPPAGCLPNGLATP